MNKQASQHDFTREFDACQDALLRYVMSMVHDYDDARDVLQETAAALWTKFEQYDPASPFGAWARRFAFLEVQKHRERSGRKSRKLLLLSDEAIEALASEFETHQEVLEQRSRLLEYCLTLLSSRDRELLKHRYWDKTNLSELAQQLGIAERTLYQRLYRIRKQIKLCIESSAAREEF